MTFEYRLSLYFFYYICLSDLVDFIVVLQSQHPGTYGFTSIGHCSNFIRIEIRILGVFLQFVENL